jgi:D-3-phosphoglycerate dehydrogenase
MRAVLWGASDHLAGDDREALLVRLRGLGLDAAYREQAAGPPREADVVLVHSGVPVGPRELDAMPALALLVSTTSGLDHVDLAAAAARGVVVERCPLARRDAVVDTALALALALLRRLPALQRRAAEGRWFRRDIAAWDVPLVRGMTVGVFGNGVIGRRAAEAWRALGADVLISDPAFPDLHIKEDVLARARVVTLHCSLTDTSRRLIDGAALARMQPGAILVNTARGECVDLPAALRALDGRGERRLAGLGLDVFHPEPPKELAALAAREDVLVTPHAAGWHSGLGRAIVAEVEEVVRAFVQRREPRR